MNATINALSFVPLALLPVLAGIYVYARYRAEEQVMRFPPPDQRAVTTGVRESFDGLPYRRPHNLPLLEDPPEFVLGARVSLERYWSEANENVR